MTAQRRHAVLATAGHVDHGKTSLIRALTGTDTDRLPDEKRRGISIELGFAEMAGEAVSFIDVPGHHRLVPAMIAGVGGVSGLLLVVAADDAVMPQTREHLWICALLGVDQVVVALSKADLVDAETLQLAEADVREALGAVGLSARCIVRTSTQTGAGIEELRAALLDMAHGAASDTPLHTGGDTAHYSSHDAPRSPGGARRWRLDAAAWLAADRVFSVRGAGTVVTGTLTSGTLRRGDDVTLAGPGGRRIASVRGLEIHGRPVDAATAPTRLAVNLGRVDKSEISRGDVLTTDPDIVVSRRLDVALTALDAATRNLADGSPVIVHVGTSRVAARITWLAAGLAHLALDHPLAVRAGLGVVVRGFVASQQHGNVLGGGSVLDAEAPALVGRKHRDAWSARAGLLDAVRQGDELDALRRLLSTASPRSVDGGDVERRFGWRSGTVSQRLGGKKRKGAPEAIPLAGSTHWATPAGLAAACEHLVALLDAHHTAHPEETGLSLETARQGLAARSGPQLAQAAIERSLSGGEVLTPSPEQLCLRRFAEVAGPQAAALQRRLALTLEEAGLKGVVERQLVETTGLEEAAVRAALSSMTSRKVARRLSQMWFAESALDQLRTSVRAHFASHAALSVADMKTIAGVGRKQAIPLLEQLDREGTTRRKGDSRVAGGS